MILLNLEVQSARSVYLRTEVNTFVVAISEEVRGAVIVSHLGGCLSCAVNEERKVEVEEEEAVGLQINFEQLGIFNMH